MKATEALTQARAELGEHYLYGIRCNPGEGGGWVALLACKGQTETLIMFMSDVGDADELDHIVMTRDLPDEYARRLDEVDGFGMRWEALTSNVARTWFFAAIAQMELEREYGKP